MKPEVMIKINTVTFTAVKTVFTIADSFRPYASTPENRGNDINRCTLPLRMFFYL